jgi:hypothetical protein
MWVRINTGAHIAMGAPGADPLGYCSGEAGLVCSWGCSCYGLDTCAFGPVSGDVKRYFRLVLTSISSTRPHISTVAARRRA